MSKKYKVVANENVWKRKNGQIINVTDMANEHLDNAINLCRRRGFRLKYNMLRRERYRRSGVS